MDFYQIWQTRGGLFGVNKLTLGDLMGIQVIMLLLLMIVMAVFIAFAPVILFGFYIILMLTQDGQSETSPTRLVVNILTVVLTLYFIVDFHFGWYSHQILATSMYAETYDAIAIRNLSIAMMSILLFFVGHELYRVGGHRVVRVVVFTMVLYFGFSVTNKISTSIVTNIATQYNDDELIKSRDDLRTWDNENIRTDEQRLDDKIDALEKEKAEQQRLKDFDSNFEKDYL